MEGGLQELDENAYWLELLIGNRTLSQEKMKSLLDETEKLNAVFTASVKTAKQRKP